MANDLKKSLPASQEVTINLDQMPILYTDNIMVTSNEDGVVLDFCQRVGSSPQVRVVARVGMSREHTKKLLMVLTGQLEQRTGEKPVGSKTVN